MTDEIRKRVAELVSLAPPISTEQREAVVRVMGMALRHDPSRPVGIHNPRKAPA